jgi:hypothetical protein
MLLTEEEYMSTHKEPHPRQAKDLIADIVEIAWTTEDSYWKLYKETIQSLAEWTELCALLELSDRRKRKVLKAIFSRTRDKKIELTSVLDAKKRQKKTGLYRMVIAKAAEVACPGEGVERVLWRDFHAKMVNTEEWVLYTNRRKLDDDGERSILRKLHDALGEAKKDLQRSLEGLTQIVLKKEKKRFKKNIERTKRPQGEDVVSP